MTGFNLIEIIKINKQLSLQKELYDEANYHDEFTGVKNMIKLHIKELEKNLEMVWSEIGDSSYAIG